MKAFIQKTLLAITMTTFVLSLPVMAMAAPAVPTGLLDAPCAPGSSYLTGDCSAYPLGIGQAVQDAAAGSIPFIDSNGELQQNNANLMWDEINNRLTLSQGLVIGGVNEILQVTVGLTPKIPVISGNYAYISNGNGSSTPGNSRSVSIIDISNPLTASVVNTVTVEGRPQPATISGNYAYVANNGNSSVSIIDISNPLTASVVNTVPVGSNPGIVAISGNYAYLANESSNSVSIIDISNPLTASVVNTVSVANGPQRVTTSGNYAYVANEDSDAVSIIDISTPASAGVVATVGVGDDPQGVTVSGNYAYVTNEGNMTVSVLDLSDISSIYAPNDVVSLSVDGTISSTILSGSGVVSLASDNNGNIVPTFSDESLKENIIDIANPLTLINNLKGHYFNWKDADRFGGNREIGFIAQEVEQVIPEVVRDVQGLKSVNYQYLTALNVEGIKAMDIRLSDLEALMGLENDSAKNSLFSRMREYLGSAVEKVIAGVVRFTGRIMQPELCLYDDAGMTCVDRSGLKDLLDQSNVTASYDGDNVEFETIDEEDEVLTEETDIQEEVASDSEVQEEESDETVEEEVGSDSETTKEEINTETEAQEESSGEEVVQDETVQEEDVIVQDETTEEATDEIQEVTEDEPVATDDESAIVESDNNNPAKEENADVEDTLETDDIIS